MTMTATEPTTDAEKYARMIPVLPQVTAALGDLATDIIYMNPWEKGISIQLGSRVTFEQATAYAASIGLADEPTHYPINPGDEDVHWRWGGSIGSVPVTVILLVPIETEPTDSVSIH